MPEKVNYRGWSDCIRLSNGKIELIITTVIGPRIIRFGFAGGPNLFYESASECGLTGGSEWRLYGGHRLWHAPEVMPRTYSPDNFPVEYAMDDQVLRLKQPTEPGTGIRKEIDISIDQSGSGVKITHRLVNTTPWTIETAPWAITAHAAGSISILPQEPYLDPELDLLPARPIVLWNYTRMADKRFTWADDFILLKHDPDCISEQKIGILNKQGWTAIVLDRTLMIKRFGYDRDAVYPDYGSNNEAYVNGSLLETETLGPLAGIKPGEAAEHIERWELREIDEVPGSFSPGTIRDRIKPLIDTLIKR